MNDDNYPQEIIEFEPPLSGLGDVVPLFSVPAGATIVALDGPLVSDGRFVMRLTLEYRD